MAIASLCLKLEKPLLMGGTFSGSFTCDFYHPRGPGCYLCMTDGFKDEIVRKLHPGVILDVNDLSWIPKDNNPVG